MRGKALSVAGVASRFLASANATGARAASRYVDSRGGSENALEMHPVPSTSTGPRPYHREGLAEDANRPPRRDSGWLRRPTSSPQDASPGRPEFVRSAGNNGEPVRTRAFAVGKSPDDPLVKLHAAMVELKDLTYYKSHTAPGAQHERIVPLLEDFLATGQENRALTEAALNLFFNAVEMLDEPWELCERLLSRMHAKTAASANLAAAAAVAKQMVKNDRTAARLRKHLLKVMASQRASPWDQVSQMESGEPNRLEQLRTEYDRLIELDDTMTVQYRKFLMRALVMPRVAEMIVKRDFALNSYVLLAQIFKCFEARSIFDLIKQSGRQILPESYMSLATALQYAPMAKKGDILELACTALAELEELSTATGSDSPYFVRAIVEGELRSDAFTKGTKQRAAAPTGAELRIATSKRQVTQVKATKAIGMFLGALKRFEHPDAERYMEIFRERMPSDLYSVVNDFWFMSLTSNSVRPVSRAEVRRCLQEDAQRPGLRVARLYEAAFSWLPEKMALEDLEEQIGIYEDMVKLAEEGRFKLRVVENSTLIDLVLRASHEAQDAEGARKWATAALRLWEGYSANAQKGITESNFHEGMAHGTTRRVVAALCRSGRRSTAVRVAHEWLASLEDLQQARTTGQALGQHPREWLMNVGVFSLGEYVSGHPPPDARHLAAQASWLLCYGVFPTRWLSEQALLALNEPSRIEHLNATELTALRHLGQVRVYEPADAIIWPTIAANGEVVDEPEEEARVRCTDYEWPSKPVYDRPIARWQTKAVY